MLNVLFKTSDSSSTAYSDRHDQNVGFSNQTGRAANFQPRNLEQANGQGSLLDLLEGAPPLVQLKPQPAAPVVGSLLDVLPEPEAVSAPVASQHVINTQTAPLMESAGMAKHARTFQTAQLDLLGDELESIKKRHELRALHQQNLTQEAQRRQAELHWQPQQATFMPAQAQMQLVQQSQQPSHQSSQLPLVPHASTNDNNSMAYGHAHGPLQGQHQQQNHAQMMTGHQLSNFRYVWGNLPWKQLFFVGIFGFLLTALLGFLLPVGASSPETLFFSSSQQARSLSGVFGFGLSGAALAMMSGALFVWRQESRARKIQNNVPVYAPWSANG